MLALTPDERAGAINTLADLLVSKQGAILEANSLDIAEANKRHTAQPLIDRLSLSPSKLKNLSAGTIIGVEIFELQNVHIFHLGLRQIAASSHTNIGRVLKKTKIADNLELRQVSSTVRT